jgi:hypothetical protein
MEAGIKCKERKKGMVTVPSAICLTVHFCVATSIYDAFAVIIDSLFASTSMQSLIIGTPFNLVIT